MAISNLRSQGSIELAMDDQVATVVIRSSVHIYTSSIEVAIAEIKRRY